MRYKSFLNFIISAVVMLPFGVSAAVPAGYYDAINGKSSGDLKTAVHNVIRPHTQLTYNSLWDHFRTTDMYPAPDNNVYWDMYSDKKRTSTYGMNREHSFPKSWWGGDQNEAYTDINHLYPSDREPNMKKSNHPLGTVHESYITYTNGVSKVGNPVSGQGGGADKVFEPDDRYKGDFARTYFYMATMYQDYTWKYKYMVQQNIYPTLTQWAIDLLLEWSRNDPVSQKELDRNEAVYKIQNNRNPFIDFPGLEEYIWGNKKGERFTIENGGTPGDPILVTPTNGTVLDFGQVVAGKKVSLNMQISGKHLVGNISLLIYGSDSKLFSIKDSQSPQSMSISSSLVNRDGGYMLNLEYEPTQVGAHQAAITIYDGGITGSPAITLKGEAVAAPNLSAPIATDPTNITETSYQANWTIPEDEVVDNFIVTRTIYKDGTKYVGEFVAEENYMLFEDLQAGTTQTYSVQSVRLGYRSPMSNIVTVAPGGVDGTFDDRGLAISQSGGTITFVCDQSHTNCDVYNIAGQIIVSIPEISNGDALTLAPGIYYIRTAQTRNPLPVIVR